MTKEARNPNPKNKRTAIRYNLRASSFVIRHCFVIRHWSFVIFLMATLRVQRPNLSWREKIYLPAIVSGLATHC